MLWLQLLLKLAPLLIKILLLLLRKLEIVFLDPESSFLILVFVGTSKTS